MKNTLLLLAFLAAGAGCGESAAVRAENDPVFEAEVENLEWQTGTDSVRLRWEISNVSDIAAVEIEGKFGAKSRPLLSVAGPTNQADVALPAGSKTWVTVRLVSKDGAKSAGRRVQVVASGDRLKYAVVGKKELYIHLPADYAASGKRYKTVYMQDGQNLFAGTEGSPVKWDADRVLDKLVAGGLCEDMILVGMSHAGSKRAEEYNPIPLNGEIGGFKTAGKGAQYANFVVSEIVPYIDSNYRTVPDREHRAVMGSSFGGLISLWTIIQHHDVFSTAGVFSPAAPMIIDTLGAFRFTDVKIWIDAGTAENTGPYYDYPFFARWMTAIMVTNGFRYGSNLFYLEDHKAFHSEADWNRRLHNAFLLFAGKPATRLTDIVPVYEKYRPQNSHDTVFCLNAVGKWDNGMSGTLLDLADYRVTNGGGAEIDSRGVIHWNDSKSAEFTVKCQGVLKTLVISNDKVVGGK